jgi:hypothetical protein
MVTALIFIVLISMLFALIFSMLSKTTQRTLNHFLLNQEELLARSAVEYAILAVGGHDISASSNCINKIDMSFHNTYDINLTIRYIGSDFPPSCNILDNTLTDPDDNGTAIIDVRVSLKPSIQEAQPAVTFARRFIQKL